MKKLKLKIVLLVVLTILSNSSCKKNKTQAVCGCLSNSISNTSNNSASLSYFTTKNTWILTENTGGVVNNYLICNSIDSLVAITSSGNNSSVYNVRFSGNIKKVCDNESFGFTPGNTSFYYIEINSLKRN